jgi:E3 ubiquitin-protein ligase BRE1
MEEQVGRADRELRAAKANGPSSTGGSAESRELKNYNDDLLVRPSPLPLPHTYSLGRLQKMLKCSNCNLRFKGVIINRCGHLFCKECIQTTLDVRARKCPTCGGAFSATDVCPVSPSSSL